MALIAILALNLQVSDEHATLHEFGVDLHTNRIKPSANDTDANVVRIIVAVVSIIIII